jgi:hypothetical protein
MVTDIDIKTQKETYRDRRIGTDIRRQTVAVKEDRDYKNRRRWTETGPDIDSHRQTKTERGGHNYRQRRVETERERITDRQRKTKTDRGK